VSVHSSVSTPQNDAVVVVARWSTGAFVGGLLRRRDEAGVASSAAGVVESSGALRDKHVSGMSPKG